MNDRPVQPSAFRLSPVRRTPVIAPRPFVWRGHPGWASWRAVYTQVPERHAYPQPWRGPVPILFDEYGDR